MKELEELLQTFEYFISVCNELSDEWTSLW